MSDFPRYFVFGEKYVAPNPYYRVDGEYDAVLVIPGIKADEEEYVTHGIAYFLQVVETRRLTETTLKKIKAALRRWDRAHGPPIM